MIVDYPGHVLLSGLIVIGKYETSTIAYTTFPEGHTQLRPFLGSCHVYRRLTNASSDMAEQLKLCIRKDVKPTCQTSDEQTQAFSALKQSLVEPPVLALPATNQPFLLDTDFLADQICMVLLEKHDYYSAINWGNHQLLVSLFNQHGTTVLHFPT